LAPTFLEDGNMNRSTSTRFLQVALGLSLAVGFPISASAQTTTGTQSLSSGSGEGTGTSTGAGAGINSTGGGTGEMTGPGSIRAGIGINVGPGIRGADAGFLSPEMLRRAMRAPRVPLTPSPGARAMPNLPTDPGIPLDMLANPLYPGFDGPSLRPEQLERLDAMLLDDARIISDPAERALALTRTARAKLFGRNYQEAHIALIEAAQAVVQVRPGLIRDLRLMGIITTLLDLAHEHIQEGLVNDSISADSEDTRPPKTLKDRMVSLNAARDEWRRAAYLATIIANANFRSEQLFKVVSGQSLESQSVAHVAEKASTDRRDLEGQGSGLLDFADRLLLQAQGHAWLIVRPVWRDQALLDITAKASASDQFPRGLEVSRTIPDPEVRTDALIRVAEGLARRNLGPEATLVYAEAAKAVSEIPTDDIRGIIAGVLIDSLIATGRFDDARASIVLLPDVTRQLVALGAVAESQGRRGLADSARRWIARDAPYQHRPMLLRRVDDGELIGVEQLRTQALTNKAR
jgi:hypothetical protein